MRKLLRWASVGVGGTALAAGLVVTALPADAASQSTALITQSQPHADHGSCTGDRHYKGDYATFVYCDGEFERVVCSPHHGDIFGPLYAANGCSTQLRLYDTKNRDKLCVNPRSSTNVLHVKYDQYSVTNDSGPC